MSNGNAFSIRPAGLDELEIAADLRAAMASEMGNQWDRDYPGWRPRFAAYFRDKQRAGTCQTFFAVRNEDGAVVGVAIFSFVDEYRATALGQLRAHVNSVFVVEPWRRRGVGRELMQAGLAWLRERGCVLVRLRASEAGRALYASLGFVAGTEMERKL